MTKTETVQVLSILRASYPAFYSKLTKRELEGIVDIWSEMFADEDVNVVKYALKELIATHTGFPPDIAALKGKIRELTRVASNSPTPNDLWVMLKNIVEDGWYGSQAHASRQFEKLPPILKRFVGSPSTLVEYSQISADVFNTVIHGQFLKQIEILEKREECSQRLPEELKEYISRLYKPIDGNRQLTEGEVNDRRNRILDQIDGLKRL